jgi:arylformamidase
MPMKYHDVTVPIHPAMPVFQGDPPVEISRFLSIEKGDAANVSSLRMGAHTGTHVDAPLHFVDGARGVDGIPLETLIGPARVVDLAEAREISSQTLADIDLKGVERILFKTSNSSLWSEGGFKKDFVYITGDAAEALVNAGIKLVGIDYLSVEKFDAATPSAHIALLEAGIVILEGLNLSKVGPGEFHLICLPLLISGCDGSPCRAVLVEE